MTDKIRKEWSFRTFGGTFQFSVVALQSVWKLDFCHVYQYPLHCLQNWLIRCLDPAKIYITVCYIHKFVSYISTKYYSNRSTSDLVIVKSKRVNFFQTQYILGDAQLQLRKQWNAYRGYQQHRRTAVTLQVDHYCAFSDGRTSWFDQEFESIYSYTFAHHQRTQLAGSYCSALRSTKYVSL